MVLCHFKHANSSYIVPVRKFISKRQWHVQKKSFVYDEYYGIDIWEQLCGNLANDIRIYTICQYMFYSNCRNARNMKQLCNLCPNVLYWMLCAVWFGVGVSVDGVFLPDNKVLSCTRNNSYQCGSIMLLSCDIVERNWNRHLMCLAFSPLNIGAIWFSAVFAVTL